jgi:hypothetical protein
MARKFLALPLTGISWFPVADFDILVDPDLSERFEHYLPAQLLIGSATLWQRDIKASQLRRGPYQIYLWSTRSSFQIGQ